MTDDAILDLARKLHALAERGVGGEKENAATMLTRLIKKHGLSLDELTTETVKKRHFTYKGEAHKGFVLQVITHVTGNRTYYKYKGVRNELATEMTTAQHLEVAMKLEHYWPLLQEKQKLMYEAFIQANKLFRQRTSDEPRPEPTPEEIARYLELRRMMGVAEVESPTKRLERPKKLTA